MSDPARQPDTPARRRRRPPRSSGGRRDRAAPARVPWPAKFGALALIWGASFFFMKIGLRSLAPLQISGLRIFSGAAVLVALLAASRGRLPRDRAVWAHLLVSAFFLCTPAVQPVRPRRGAGQLGAWPASATPPPPSPRWSSACCSCAATSSAGARSSAVLVGFLGVLVIMQPWQSAGRPDLRRLRHDRWSPAPRYGLGWTYNKRFLRGSDLGGLSLPAAQLTVASAQMVVVLLLWWATTADRLPAPWSVHAPGHGRLGAGCRCWPCSSLGVVGTASRSRCSST